MSRSDGTDAHGRPPPRRWQDWSLPRGTGRVLRRQWQKQQRQQARAALGRQQEPEPARPRHSVIWNYW